jgi:GH15 family glucan-1,4-alpha-glucosidase
MSISLPLSETGRDETGMSAYLPIEDHGVIGDLRTVALVGTDGTIDWYCPGRFDAPSLFGALLDREKGGRYSIAPAHGNWRSRQLYFPDTNILITRFLSEEGVTEVIDFMPVAKPGDGGGRLLRTVLAIRGEMPMRIAVEPRFNYARDPHETHAVEGGAVFASGGSTSALSSAVPLQAQNGGAYAEFTLEPDQRTSFVLEQVEDGGRPRRYSEGQARELFTEAIDFWTGWLRQCRYAGRWREMVHRSALTLKLLTYEPTGAIVAATTTSLPEQLGGERNWDYRFTWIRDASFSLYALLRLGFTEEAAGFMDWLTGRFMSSDMDRESGPLQIMYGIDGREDLTEETLDHLEGYRGSAPVRIGNGAADQLQLDIYGELIDSVYLYNKHARPIYHDAWQGLSRIIDWVSEHWDEADEGVWETRGGRQHFTYSRLMSWVAVERAVRMARQRGLPADLVGWMGTRDRVYEQIMSRGWHQGRQAFVQHYDTEVLDASVLLMPLVKFVSPTDPRWLSTLDAITRELVSDSLVYRYNAAASPDGLAGDEGTFSICSFWWVEALSRAGRLDEARIAFDKMLTYANHLGLYAEEIGPAGEQLGNFPQAFTHLALISAAFDLDRKLG